MIRATVHFNHARRRQVSAAVFDAESRTSAEIVPVVATASGRYDRAEDLVGLIAGIGAMTVTWAWLQRVDDSTGGWDGLPLTVPLPVLVLILIGGFVVGAIVASRVGWLRRLFVSRLQMATEVAERAAAIFHDSRVHHTGGEAGVLVYLSLFEQGAVILADRAAFEALGQETLDAICRELTAELRGGGDVTASLCATIRRLGDALAPKLPRRGNDRNELADALVTID